MKPHIIAARKCALLNQFLAALVEAGFALHIENVDDNDWVFDEHRLKSLALEFKSLLAQAALEGQP